MYLCSYPFLHQEEGAVDQIIDTLLQMLKKDVVDNSKSCAEYFEFFKNYATSVSVLNFCGDNYELRAHVPINTDMLVLQPLGCRHLIVKDAFVIFMEFLLGHTKSSRQV